MAVCRQSKARRLWKSRKERASAEKPGLANGKEVYAVIKAPNVIIAVD
jgi:molybdopterin-binding protein